METILLALGASALLGFNVVVWVWAGGIIGEIRRERRDAGLLPELARLATELRRKDELIANQNRDLMAISREASAMSEHMKRCGVYRELR